MCISLHPTAAFLFWTLTTPHNNPKYDVIRQIKVAIPTAYLIAKYYCFPRMQEKLINRPRSSISLAEIIDHPVNEFLFGEIDAKFSGFKFATAHKKLLIKRVLNGFPGCYHGSNLLNKQGLDRAAEIHFGTIFGY